MGYAKLWRRLLTSSINDCEVETRWFWICLLAAMDAHGVVNGTPAALARAANLPLESVEKALEEFQAPDLNSHSQEFEGRRLQRLEGNDWLILNAEKYRRMQSEEEAREKTREKVARWRQKQRELGVTDCNQDVTPGNESNHKREVRSEKGEVDTSSSSESDDLGVDRPDTVPLRDIKMVVEAYHAAIAGTRLPQVKALSDSRKRVIAARIREHGLKDVIKAMSWIQRSAFLRGETGRDGWPGATIDWIMGPRNFIKVIEGNYADKKGADPLASFNETFDRLAGGQDGS